MSASPSDREAWWSVIKYEVNMLRALNNVNLSVDGPQIQWIFDNLITEGKVLHTRNLCDFCTSRKPSDIKICDLFDNYSTDDKYRKLRELVELLIQGYGKSDQVNSSRWVFNKMAVHPTKERGMGFDYNFHLKQVWPVLQNIIDELELLRGQPL